MRQPLWQHPDSAQRLQRTAEMVARTRRDSLDLARQCLRNADECERQLARAGYAGWLLMIELDSCDPNLLAIEVHA